MSLGVWVRAVHGLISQAERTQIGQKAAVLFCGLSDDLVVFFHAVPHTGFGKVPEGVPLDLRAHQRPADYGSVRVKFAEILQHGVIGVGENGKIRNTVDDVGILDGNTACKVVEPGIDEDNIRDALCRSEPKQSCIRAGGRKRIAGYFAAGIGVIDAETGAQCQDDLAPPGVPGAGETVAAKHFGVIIDGIAGRVVCDTGADGISQNGKIDFVLHGSFSLLRVK